MAVAMASPWKHPQTGVFYLRVRVPRDVLSRVGRDIEKVSLRTKDPARARYAFTQKLAEVQARWDEIRKGVQILTDRQIEALAGEVYRAFRARLPQDDRGWPVQHAFSFWRWSLEMVLGEEPYLPGHPEAHMPIWQRAERAVGEDVAKILADHGISVDAFTHQRLMVASARSTLQAIRQSLREAQGDWRSDPDADRFPPTLERVQGAKPKLDFETFWTKVSGGYSQATKRRWRPIVLDLLSSCGKEDVAALTEEDVEAWRDATIESARKTARTFARNDLSAAKTMFGNAVTDKLLTTNPARDVKVRLTRRDKGREMRGFYDDEAALILSSALEEGSPRASRHLAVATRWVPWICAYTGGRVNEITQLRAGDIREIEGIWCIHITPEAGTQKTETKRHVPMHEHLVEMGLIALIHDKAPGARLFARTADDGEGSPQEVGKSLARWVRRLGVSDPDVWPNHGWRHRLKTEARARMPEQFSDALLGHAPKTQGRKYGAYPPRILAPHIACMPRFVLDQT